MYFAQKIYINDKPLVLTTDAQQYIQEHPKAVKFSRFKGVSHRKLMQSVAHLNEKGTFGAIIEDESEEALLEELYAKYTPIEAGGGVVENEEGDILMIFRRGKWDLPKGKLDEGEEIDECAIREVSEETGLERLKLGDKVCDTYHVYVQKKKNMIKRTAWYKMTGTIKEKPEPQEDEGIEKAKWVKREKLGPLIDKSYEAIKEVMHKAGLTW